MFPAHYTMTLQEYLDSGYTLPANIKEFYPLDYAGNKKTVEELFLLRCKYKEIGCETQELFKHELEVIIDEALIKYNMKLKLYIDNYNSLMKRTVKEIRDGNTSVDNTSADYLNPANLNAEKLQGKVKTNGASTYHEEFEKGYSYLKSNPELMKEAIKIENQLFEILQYLDRAFIGIF